MTGVSPEELQNLLEHGWRRFGLCYFRPICSGCMACESIRVPVGIFKPTASQRRVLRKCADLRVRIGKPAFDAARMALYEKWHCSRESTKGWEPQRLAPEEYVQQFCIPHPSAREMAYYMGTELVGIGLVDQTPEALSSVYFYFDPQIARLSPGIASILTEIGYAREQGLRHLYLGYRVQECPSLAYKGNFGPHELLEGRPELQAPALWTSSP